MQETRISSAFLRTSNPDALLARLIEEQPVACIANSRALPAASALHQRDGADLIVGLLAS
jgi:hypothetical protein